MLLNPCGAPSNMPFLTCLHMLILKISSTHPNQSATLLSSGEKASLHCILGHARLQRIHLAQHSHLVKSSNWDGLVVSNVCPQMQPSEDAAPELGLSYGLRCTTLPSMVFVGTATIGLYPLAPVLREELSHNAETWTETTVSVCVSGVEALMEVKTQRGVISVGDDDGRG